MKKTNILDVCCGGKMFYFNKEDSRVLFQDIREVETTLCDGRPWKIKPDVVGDFRSMQFADGSFSLVVFDPPHLLRNTGKSKFADIYGSLNPKAKPTGWQQIKYGALGQTDWQDTLRLGFKECFRVLRNGGFLIFKWNETDIPLSKILALTEQKPLLGHRVGKLNKTHWILFVKEE